MIKKMVLVFSVVLVSLFCFGFSASAIETQKNFGVGMEVKNKIVVGTTSLYGKGQWAAEILRVVHVNLALAVSRPRSGFWFEGQGNFQLYPLSFFVPREFRFLPYLSAGAISKNAKSGHLLAAGLDLLGTQNTGINFSGAQATLAGQKSNRYEISLFWR